MNTHKQQSLFPNHEPDIIYEEVPSAEERLNDYLQKCMEEYWELEAKGLIPWADYDDNFTAIDLDD